MAEVAFAKQFLASCDARPQKLPGDYVADPRSLPAQPAFTLPRTNKSFAKSDQSSAAAGSAAPVTLSVVLSAFRQSPSSPAPVTLDLPAKTSVYDVKVKLGAHTGYAPDKLKLLWERKPVNDSKTISEATGVHDGKVDIGVMYVGAPTATPVPQTGGPPSEDAQMASEAVAAKTEADAPAPAQPSPGVAELETDEFWSDLQGYLTQRLRDDAVAGEAAANWRKAWKSR